jgi:hypothetical protein
MEFSGGIQFGGGMQLTAPPTITVGTIPNSTIAPVVFNSYHPGASNVGQTLSCTTGTWEGTLPITYTYQWRRANTIGGYGTPTGNNNIASATSNTYVVVTDDQTREISCTVTATNSAGSASANSNHAGYISYIGHTPWIVSESPEYANWLNNNGIVSFDVSFGRRRIFNSTGAPKSDMSANNQIIISLPISSSTTSAANAELAGTEGNWFGGKTFTNAEVTTFVTAMNTGTQIVFYNTSQNIAGKLTLTDNARIVERSPNPAAGISGGRMIVANVNASFKDGINDNANEIVYGGANASIGEWFMYGSANVGLRASLASELQLTRIMLAANLYPWALGRWPEKFSDYIDPLDRGEFPYKDRQSFNGVYTGNIYGGNLAMLHPTIPNLYISTRPGGGGGGRNGDIIWGRSRVFNSTGAPKSDMSANNEIIIGLPMCAYESHAYGGANIFLNGTDGQFYSAQFFSNSEVNVFVSAMTTGTQIKFYGDTNYVQDSRSLNPPVAILTLQSDARIVERSPNPAAGINGVRMIVATVTEAFKDGSYDSAGEIVDASANASIGEWFMYGSANIILRSNILTTYATS